VRWANDVWNSGAGFFCSKVTAAITAGCTAVVRPSEMSSIHAPDSILHAI
jgi:acyl-CoA reductase-like NAD-dependent aldehyde dehydrogenase